MGTNVFWKIRHKETKLWFGKGRWHMKGKCDKRYIAPSFASLTGAQLEHQRFFDTGGNVYQRFANVRAAMCEIKQYYGARFCNMLEIIEIQSNKEKVVICNVDSKTKSQHKTHGKHPKRT